jgi:hypothetical protein
VLGNSALSLPQLDLGGARRYNATPQSAADAWRAWAAPDVPVNEESAMEKQPRHPTLELVTEGKIREFLAGSADDRLEASGVCFRDGYFYVIFDNSPHVARLESSLTIGHPASILLRQRGESVGFEDITYHERERRFLVILEAVIFGDRCYKPLIEEYDDDFRYLECNWVDFSFDRANKGIEGLTYVHRHEEDYVLGMCEGNKCKGGKAGRKPGGGRIQLFQKGEGQWDHVGTLKLPKAVQFQDYACLNVDGNRIAVVSQMSSALWVGELREEAWDFVDEGTVYHFPRDEQGEIVYCNVEGVAWTAPNQVVVVSDRRKPGEQPDRCCEKDQSIHLFNIPEPDSKP